MKLLPMLYFVIKYSQPQTCNESENEYLLHFMFRRRVTNYANFLNQPLNNGMFFPCDENGNILEKIPVHRFADDPHKYRQYKEATKKVLFEGFISIDTRANNRVQFELYGQYRTSANIDTIESDQYGLFFYNSSMQKQRVKKVEDLLNFCDLTLTSYAINQIL